MPLTQSDVTKVTSAETQEGAAPMEDEETKDDYVVNDHSELRERFGAKTAALVEFLQDRVHTSSSFIIFSEWEKQLQYVGSVLSAQGITNKWARGNIAVRNKAVRDFNSGACKVLMLSFDYMASGLDLSKADHVLFLGPLTKGQNVATVEQQAIGRALRAGQTKQVNLIRFITEGTIEQQYNDARTS
ncbi:MAG: SWF/SNF helicase family protein, partial [Gammaproteobacteria bacterium]|nr:SWF/SNF helicase family protein [Gammaproteobacteria bacterium]